MEKRRPNYDLRAIFAHKISVADMNLTQSALQGIRAAGMTQADALEELSGENFYKSMTTHQSHRVWQDVYHTEWRGKALYVKFQQAGVYFVVSFKES